MWNRLSADELEYRSILQDDAIIRPRVNGTRLIEFAILEALKRLGVDTLKDTESIRWQMEIMGITIHDLDIPGMIALAEKENLRPSDNVLGFYIYRALVPMYFISDPHVNKDDGRIGIWLYPIEGPGTSTLIVEGGLTE